MSPGPDFALVTRFAIPHGWRIGLRAFAGVALGVGVDSTAAIAGVGIVVVALSWPFRAVSCVDSC
ncbi:LysE family transporter [Streptomyces sp. YIM 121038]|uniref:LysE family transporter n=1 Tax=Streptomyces sp. YIM 121038 TaxID=2136401 RepID=UPI0011103828|nr:LysE family transporter [Streptomyces sp. YIM 121038]